MTPGVLTSRVRYAVDLHGYGQVAQALVPLLERAGIPIASIHDSRGPRAVSGTSPPSRVLVDATSPRYEGPKAEAWIGRLETALASGTSVVTCNKAPLALAWDRLVGAAEAGGSTLALSATVGGGTPVLAFLRRLQAREGLVRVEACLSGTWSFVLDRVRRGVPFAEAVRAAQRNGFAEPDPRLDLDGTDVFAKALIIHNRLFAGAGAQVLSDARPRLELNDDRIQELVLRGLVAQAVATVEPGRVRVELQGRPVEDALLGPRGSATVVATSRRGTVHQLTGPGAGPAVTAASLLGDLETLQEADRGRGVTILP